MMFKPLMLCLLSFFLITELTWAEKKSTEETKDKENIIAVIDAQLDAFRSGDAEKAYSFASPGIQRQFPNSAIFMQMVMNSYNVLRQPTQVEYQDLREHFGVWVQTTQLTDLNGFTFQAFYQMEQQTSGEWRIGGCMIQQVERDKI
jgi:hypothetical protein